MPTSLTRNTLYNMALDGIGELPVSPGISNPYSRWLDRNYTQAVEASLREQPWNFAIELHQLNRTDDPPFRWRYAYDLPPGWLRVLPLTVDGRTDGEPYPFAVVSNVVNVDYSGAVKAAIVMNRQDPGQWDPLFANYVIARLANGMAYRFTQKASFVKQTSEAMIAALDTAAEVNAFEGTIEPIEQYDIIRARGY